MAFHNETEWCMDTLWRACHCEWLCIHPQIPELCNVFQITSQMPSRLYTMASDVNTNQIHNFNTVYIIWWMTICEDNTLMFVLVFYVELCIRATSCMCFHCHLAAKNLNHDGKHSQLNCRKVTKCEHVTIEIYTNGVEASLCWVFVRTFPIDSTPRCHCHAGTNISSLLGHTFQIRQGEP